MLVSAEHHGRELSGAFAGCVDSLKESALLLCLLSLFALASWPLFWTLFAGWLVWKVGRSALLGWARLERLHRLIEEERFEVEHHREQEKEELKEMYESKGLSGKLLDEIVEILMSDDNRLLEVMLTEELGLTLESYEHPLRQAFGAGLGVILAFGLGLSGWLLFAKIGLFSAAGLLFIVSSLAAAKREKNGKTKALVWNLAVGAIAIGAAFFVHGLFF